jgi:hypothetical protein
MNELQTKQLQILDATVAHFNSKNLSFLKDVNGSIKNCLYAPTEGVSTGCAVGRLIKDKDLCRQLDSLKNKPVSDIAQYLPDEIKKLGITFLGRLQRLHDIPSNWNENGLTKSGKDNYDKVYEFIKNNEVAI